MQTSHSLLPGRRRPAGRVRRALAGVAAASFLLGVGAVAVPTASHATPPGTPYDVTAVAGDGEATVSFTLPGDGNVASGPTDPWFFQVRVYDGSTLVTTTGNYSAIGTAQSMLVGGLANGTTYTFKVRTGNGYWSGPNEYSAEASVDVTPSGSTWTPTNVTATASTTTPGRVTVSWDAPSPYTGGSAISGYRVTPSGGSMVTVGASTTSKTFNLTPSSSYTFAVQATNTGGKVSTAVTSSSVTTSINPGTPTSVTAVAGDGEATVSFTLPDEGNVSSGLWDPWHFQVKVYSGSTLVATTGNYSAQGTAQSIVVPELVNGTSYTFKVRVGNGYWSGPNYYSAEVTSNAVTPSGTTWAPTNVTATVSTTTPGRVTVSWNAPSPYTGGSAISGYKVTPSGGSTVTVGASTTSKTFNLTPGSSYTFSVQATNTGGKVSSIVTSSSVTTTQNPGAPTSVSAVAGDGEATVSFTLPDEGNVSSGLWDPWHFQVKVYSGSTLVATTGNYSAEGTAQSIVVPELVNGTSYTFKVRVGNGYWSGPNYYSAEVTSNAVTPSGQTWAPTNVTATASTTTPGRVTVSWNAPSPYTGGSAISGYRVTPSGGSTVTVGATATSKTFDLTPGSSYTFSVQATNTGGKVSSIVSSSSVTTNVNPGTPTNVSAVAGDGQATVSWTLPDSGNVSFGPWDPWFFQVKVYSGSTLVTTTGNYSAEGTAQSMVVTGLTNGTAYTFKVVAGNGYWSGPNYYSAESAASNAVTPSA